MKESTASLILQSLKKEDIKSVTHCATRLRIGIDNPENFNLEDFKEIKGIIGAIYQGGQLQIIIGPNVENTYNEFKNLLDQKEASSSDYPESKLKTNPLNAIFSFISGSLTPLFPVLIAMGIIKGLNILLSLSGLVGENSQTLILLEGIGNAGFFFFPILIGFSSSQKLNINPYIGAALGATLLVPEYTQFIDPKGELNIIHFLGIPIYSVNYANTLIPIWLGILIAYWVQKISNKILPEMLKPFLTPVLILLITAPLILILIGPISIWLSSIISDSVSFLYEVSPILTGAFVGAIWPLLVIFGLHWAIIPLFLLNLENFQCDSISALAISSLYSQIGVALAIYLKTKDKDQRSMMASSLLTAIITGVTEPILYGMILVRKKAMLMVIIMGGFLGALTGALKINFSALNMGGIIGIPAVLHNQNFFWYILVIILGVLLTTFLTITFKVDKS